ncbi:NERD domain-containing protein [Bacillus cereus group sp. MYBK30-1]|uniref:nuclease-related domain-containing DEAD/DEAH box helicase n=1 Tax=unclassified Bacillus cereus group TaxID=2750818 RepID=UPI003F7A3808
MSEIFESFNRNDPRTAGEERLLHLFRSSSRFEEWIIFEQPHINSMKPDFVLLHPERGIVIIEVKDWNLNSRVYESGAYIRGTDGRQYKKDPINQVESYKDGILKSELQNSIYLAENYSNYYGCIETVVYFHGISKAKALEFCQPKNNYTKIWTDEDLLTIYNSQNKLKAYNYTYALANEKSHFNRGGLLAHLVEELSKHLQYADYNFERKQPYVLTRAQRNLAELNPGTIRRWSGVAGSGKSLVLADKAVRALKNDKRVLVVTFNITLRHYIRDLCSQQFGVGNYKEERRKLREDLTILHFHGLLKAIMTEHEIVVDIQEEEMDFTNRWISVIKKYTDLNRLKEHFNYDYILIDEGQDFKRDWVLFLKQLFTQHGELFIVYDKAQDLFGRFEQGVWIEEPDQVKSIGFKGKPGSLKYTHRLPDTMVQKIHRVREQLQIEGEEILVARQEQGNLLQMEFWYNYQAYIITEKLAQLEYHVNILRETNGWEDITILTTNEHTGASIVEFFESKGIRTSHVYDLQREGDIDRRRSEKWKFHGGTGRLKVCSYHSYKGWQTPNVILVLDSPSTRYLNGQISFQTANQQQIKNALFISMSRVKGKATTGEYSFVCLNYLQEYNHLKSIFS